MVGFRTARAATAFLCLGMGAASCTLLTDLGDLSGGSEAGDARVDLSNVILYVDGVERSRTATSRLVSDTPTIFRIGRGEFFGGGFFPGKMDEVAVYDHALPPTRVQAHYAAR